MCRTHVEAHLCKIGRVSPVPKSLFGLAARNKRDSSCGLLFWGRQTKFPRSSRECGMPTTGVPDVCRFSVLAVGSTLLARPKNLLGHVKQIDNTEQPAKRRVTSEHPRQKQRGDGDKRCELKQRHVTPSTFGVFSLLQRYSRGGATDFDDHWVNFFISTRILQPFPCL